MARKMARKKSRRRSSRKKSSRKKVSKKKATKTKRSVTKSKPARLVAPPRRRQISEGMALAGLLLNILVIPGLGSIVAGRTRTGTIQIILTVISIPLMLIFIGFPILIGTWIWGLITGIQLIQEANR